MEVLISPGFGAGWSTWACGKMAAYIRTYKPLIDALKNGEDVNGEHPVIKNLCAECEEMFGESPYLGGLADLCVRNATPPFQIHDYDGYESIVAPGEDNSWIMEGE